MNRNPVYDDFGVIQITKYDAEDAAIDALIREERDLQRDRLTELKRRHADIAARRTKFRADSSFKPTRARRRVA